MQRQSSVQPATATGWRPGAGEHGRQEHRGRGGPGGQESRMYVCLGCRRRMRDLRSDQRRSMARGEPPETRAEAHDWTGLGWLGDSGWAWMVPPDVQYSTSIYSRTSTSYSTSSAELHANRPSTACRPRPTRQRGSAWGGPRSIIPRRRRRPSCNDARPAHQQPQVHSQLPCRVSLQTRTHPYVCVWNSTRPGGQYDSTTWRHISSISPPDGLGSFP